MTDRAPSPREIAAERLRARAARLRTIRRRVFATVLATFAIAFGVIGATGSMGQSSNTTSLASSGTTSSSSDSSGTTSSDDSFGASSSDSSGTSSSNSTNSQQSAGAPMTTRQS